MEARQSLLACRSQSQAIREAGTPQEPLAIGGVLSAVICISDPLRPEAKGVIRALRALGIRKTVMLTGDSDRTAAAIAAEVGVDDYRSEVLPEDKASYVAAEHAAGRTVSIPLVVSSGEVENASRLPPTPV